MSPNTKLGKDCFPSPDILHSLLTKATTEDGHPESFTLPKDIPWFDESLAKKGRLFVESNFFIILLLNLINTFMGLANKPIAVLSYPTFYPKCVAGPRYLSTVKSMLSWFISPDYGKDSLMFKEVERVRKLHKMYARPDTNPVVPNPDNKLGPECEELANLIKSDLENVDTSLCPHEVKGWSPPLLFTQYELAFVVYASVSSVYLFPEKLGLPVAGNLDLQDGISGYIHLWAVVGRMLGLRDEFNVALNPDRKLYTKMMRHLGFGTLKLMDASVAFLWYDSVRLFNELIPFNLASAKAILYFVLEAGDVEPKNLGESMNYMDNLSYYLISLLLWCYREIWLFKKALNYLSYKIFSHVVNKSKPMSSYR